jgi:hypothetical protein
MKRPTISPLWEALALLVLVAAQVAAVIVLGLRGVDAFDMSIIPDGGYRIYCGQVPYRDFHMPVGPVVFYFQAAFFALWGGYDWLAVVAHAAAVGAAATAITYLVLRVFSPPLPSFAFAALAAVIFSLPVSFPWPDHTAFLFVLAALGVFAVAARPGATSAGRVLLLAVTSGLAVSGALLSKHSIGGGAVIVVGLLWLLVPLQHETFRVRLLRAAVFGVALALFTALAAAWLESRGSFLAEVFTSTGQMWRFRRLTSLELLARDFRGERFLMAADLWLALALLAVPILRGWRWLAAGSARPARLAVALSAVAITLFARRVGAAPPFFFAGLLPLAAGLGYGLLGEGVSSARAGLVVVGCAAVALLVLRLVADAGVDPLGQFQAASRLVAFVSLSAGLLLTRPSLGRQRLVSAARAFLVTTALALGVFYLPLHGQRKGWDPYPEVRGASVPMASIPAFHCLRGRPEISRDYEELVDWLRPRLDADPPRPGQDVFIVPQGQLLYGALGVESFRGIRLWYHDGVSYTVKDPDTELVVRTRPRFIVVHRSDRDYISEPGQRLGREAMASMPGLEELLAQHYAPPVELQGFRVYERQPDPEAPADHRR